MPELPEVETLRRQLNSAISGKIFADIWSNWPKGIRPAVLEFKKAVKGKKIVSVQRSAKILIFKLSGDLFLLIHLKLTGQLIYQFKVPCPRRVRLWRKSSPPEAGPPLAEKFKVVAGGHPQRGGAENLPNQFTHIIFTFTDGSKLYFNDLRKFGWAKLATKEEKEKLSKEEIGIEPLSKEFTLEKFKEILARRPNKKIKQVLMEQNLIAGLGNIYADESCFCAKILPTRQTKTLREKEIKDLFYCIPKILDLAISKKGTSVDTYIQLSGEPGGFVPYLKVYGRAGQKCKGCGGVVKKIKLAGRGTHFCPKCQK